MLKERLQEDIKTAMKARDEVRLRTVRSLRAALMEREIELRTGGTATLTHEQEMAVVQKQAKQRRDAAEQYRDAGRGDLVKKEEDELVIIDEYLPRQMGDEELGALVREVVKETGAESMRDMGKVMGAAMPRVQGKADGKRVQAAVRAALGG
jgi:hypothetical protein